LADHRDMFLAALEFTSLSMLGWLAAAVLPWLVHRWFRRPRQTTHWAAVELLLTAVRQRSTRIHVQQWLLLLIRTAILVLIPLAAAGAVWRHWNVGAGGQPRTHHILVLDQSYSMSCEADGSTRLDRAKQRAREIVESGQRGDAYSILAWGQIAENVIGRPTFDETLAVEAIDGMPQAQTPANLGTALRAVATTIDRSGDKHSHHDVVFITDLGRNSWAIDSETQAQVDELAKRARLTVLDVGDARRGNLAVVELKVEPALVLRQHQVDIIATLRNFSANEQSAVEVALSVDGQQIETQSISFPANSETVVRFSHSFVSEGAQTVEVSLLGLEDGLQLDNRRWVVVNVLPQLRVACFAAESGSADDVARALAPRRSSTGVDSFSPIEPKVFPLGRLSQMNLEEFDAVVLCALSELSPREAAQIERFVRQGGGLAMLLGDVVAGGRSLQPLLPTKLLQIQDAGVYHFDPLDYDHPIVRLFRGQNASGLLNVSVNRYVQMQVNDGSPAAEVVIAFDSGDPALVVSGLGLGRVAVMAIPCSLAVRTSAGTPWSSFAVSPSFLPIVRELVSYLVDDSWQHQRNLLVGQQATTIASGGGPLDSLEMRLPEGDKHHLKPPAAEDLQEVSFADTSTVGVYSLSAADAEIARFAVNLDARESDLSTVDPAGLPPGFTSRSVVSAASIAGFGANFSLSRTLLGMALALLITETTFAWLLGRGWG